ncbi:MAG: hypothetical protein IT450_01080 [Phycisphaerales bacterium]|nr:hypothetical protein [Phycisphaerales bacterium]
MRFRVVAASSAAMAAVFGLALMLGGCPTTDNGNTNGSGNDNTNEAAASAERGRLKFDAECSACHPASYVAPFRDLIVNDLGMLGPTKEGIVLTDQEVADLKEYLAGI